MKPIQVGDLVAYRADFLVNTGQQAGCCGKARGKVVNLTDLSRETVIAEVEWDNPDVPLRVNVKNLCHVGGVGFSRR